MSIKTEGVKMIVSGIELYPVNVRGLSDKDPVYIEFDEGSMFTSQWGIVDQIRQVTIHKDFILTFNDKCRYYSLCKQDEQTKQKMDSQCMIVKF